MRPILRFIWAALVNLSLLAMAIIIWLWIRSHGGADGAYTVRERSDSTVVRYEFVSHDGAIWIARIGEPLAYLYATNTIYFDHGQKPADVMGRELPPNLVPRSKFTMERSAAVADRFGHVNAGVVLSLPHWLAVVVLAHLPAAALWSAIRRRQRRNCQRCGAPGATSLCEHCGQRQRGFAARFGGRIFALAAGLSLIAALAIAAAWLAAQFGSLNILLRTVDNTLSVGTRGVLVRKDGFDIRVSFEQGMFLHDLSRARSELRWHIDSPRSRSEINLVPVFDVAGIGYWNYSPQPSNSYRHGTRIMIVPYWLALSIFATIPAFYARSRLRERRGRLRRLRGLCEKCGYDLRASAGVCPECGHAPAPRL